MDGVRAGQDVIDAADDSDLVGGSLLLEPPEEKQVNNKTAPCGTEAKTIRGGKYAGLGHSATGLGNIQKHIKGAIKMTLTGAIRQ